MAGLRNGEERLAATNMCEAKEWQKCERLRHTGRRAKRTRRKRRKSEVHPPAVASFLSSAARKQQTTVDPTALLLGLEPRVDLPILLAIKALSTPLVAA